MTSQACQAPKVNYFSYSSSVDPIRQMTFILSLVAQVISISPMVMLQITSVWEFPVSLKHSNNWHSQQCDWKWTQANHSVVQNNMFFDFLLLFLYFWSYLVEIKISSWSPLVFDDFASIHEGILAFSVLDSMLSTISAKSSQLCGDQVSLSDRPWMSSYIMHWTSLDEFLHNAVCELTVNCVLT
jgi:hypothetical protein